MLVLSLTAWVGIGCASTDPSTGSAAVPPAAPAASAARAPTTQTADGDWQTIASVATFEDKVLKSQKPVLVEFVLPHCVGCRQMASALKRLMGEYGRKVAFAKVDLSDVPDLAKTHSIPGTPTILVFAKGKEAKRLIGVKSEMQLRSAIDLALSK